ncbi:hypothetical protein [Rahnella perminowiae]|uniref:hypothetical protein n=1 Tax=Rahnella perminowiae TaxID=2816244 RepID=UPI00215C5CC7|nr:hypothetical protein [Rahnella perminowiae]MCR9001782.1 hypothetical protein [Rahnella perminowiae]
MNNAEIRQLRVLGGMMSSQKNRVNDLLAHDRLQMPSEVITFSKAVMAEAGLAKRVNSAHINTVYERNFVAHDNDGEYALIVTVLNNELSK